MTPQDSTDGTRFGDGCEGEHSPSSNLGCVMGPGQDDGRRADLAAVTDEPGGQRDWQPFDPQAAAQDAPAGESPLATVVGQFGGYLSACWDNLEGAGVFESERAADAVERLVGWLEQRGVSGPRQGHHHEHSPMPVPGVATFEPGDRLLLVSPTTGDVEPAELQRIIGEIDAALDDTSKRVQALQGMSLVVLKPDAGR